MNARSFLVGAAAVVAIAGCNSQQGDAATKTPLKVENVAPPAGGDWTQMVTRTPEGGFLMGNPNAKVRLIEFASMTCPHCAEFEETAGEKLANTYVKTGQVSYEFRNYVRDGFDLAASLVARCNGEKGFFPMTRALLHDQDNWLGKIQGTPEAQLQPLQNLPPNRQFVEMAKIAGFQQFAAMRGVPEAKSTQCLADQNAVNQLVEMSAAATTEYPDFKGTPTFIINGKMTEGPATWANLEPQIRNALGERG
jgi:protein-disulfide isomerase